MRLAAIIAVLVAVGAFWAFSAEPVHAQSQDKDENETHEEVSQGDTLSGIAQAHDTVYQRLFRANDKIEDPHLIYPGQMIRIPAEDEELPQREVSGSEPQSAPQPEPEPQVQAQQSSPAPAPQPEPEPAPEPQPDPQPASTSAGVWDRVAACESNGDWSINTGNGFYGGLQFTLSSWQAVGGSGYPHHASKSEQINRAERLLAIQGWGAWPSCSAQLGLR